MSPKDYIEKRKRAEDGQYPAQQIPLIPVIEHGIPIPQEKRGGQRQIYRFYPFEKMEKGDSFWVPAGVRSDKLSKAINHFSGKSGWKFVKRGMTKNGRMNKEVSGVEGKTVRGYRVWRVK